MSTDVCIQALATALDAMSGDMPALSVDELQRIKAKLDGLIRDAEIANAVHGLENFGLVRPER